MTDAHAEYASGVVSECRGVGLRAELDSSGEKLGALIRRARLAKIPYVLVVGDKDVAAGTVGVNQRSWPKPEQDVPLSAFLDEVRDEVARKGMPEDRAPAAAEGAPEGAAEGAPGGESGAA